VRDLANEVLTYAREHDKRVAALVLQTVASTDAVVARLQESAKGILAVVVDPLMTIHKAAGDALAALVDLLAKNEIVRLVVNETIVTKLEAANGEIQNTDRPALLRIQQLLSSDSAAAFADARALAQRWNATTPALARAVSTIADLVEHLIRGDLGALVNADGLRRAVLDFARSLESRMREFVPTSAHLSYAWNTSIKPFPGNSRIFSMV